MWKDNKTNVSYNLLILYFFLKLFFKLCLYLCNHYKDDIVSPNIRGDVYVI